VAEEGMGEAGRQGAPTISWTFVKIFSEALLRRPGSMTARTSIPSGCNCLLQGRKACPFPPAQWKQSSLAFGRIEGESKEMIHFLASAMVSVEVIFGAGEWPGLAASSFQRLADEAWTGDFD
jgi:hypothetical protein